MDQSVEPARTQPILLWSYQPVEPGALLSIGATVDRYVVYCHYVACAYDQLPLLTKPGVGGHGEGNGASVGHSIDIYAGLGRNAKGKSSRRKYRAGNGEGCEPAEAGI